MSKWNKPQVKEIAVGLEINCYACAEIQRVATTDKYEKRYKGMGSPKMDALMGMPLSKFGRRHKQFFFFTFKNSFYCIEFYFIT